MDAQEVRLLDWLDLDDDGVSEVVTITRFYESWGNTVFAKRGEKWANVYEAQGDGS